MDQEGPIENYQEFFDDILDEHRRFVSITRLPQFWFDEDLIPDNEFAWGKTCGNILVKNEGNARPESGLGLLLVEHWMIFPELVEPAIVEAINEGEDIVAGKCKFTLNTFLEVKGSFTFVDIKAAENFKRRWENGEVAQKVMENIRKQGYDGNLTVRYFNSNLTESKNEKK